MNIIKGGQIVDKFWKLRWTGHEALKERGVKNWSRLDFDLRHCKDADALSEMGKTGSVLYFEMVGSRQRYRWHKQWIKSVRE